MPPPLTTDLATAAAALAAGKLVAFPTETVYGLGADATNPTAVAALYRAKNRPPTHPVIIHLPTLAAAAAWARPLPPAARLLAHRFMPGPLTLIVPRLPHLGHLAGGDLIALRIPAHPLARRLIQMTGRGIAAPSANRFGGVSPTRAAHVADEFSTQTDLLILDGGPCPIGIESTIVGFSGDTAHILRPGDIDEQAIASCGIAVTPPPRHIPAPGTLPRHYAPTKAIHLTTASRIPFLLRAAPTQAAAILSPHPPFPTLPPHIHWRRAAPDPAVYARELYHHLRRMDALPVSRLIVAAPPTTPPWQAVTDRLRRAATPPPHPSKNSPPENTT